jgi:hypothetical protein
MSPGRRWARPTRSIAHRSITAALQPAEPDRGINQRAVRSSRPDIALGRSFAQRKVTHGGRTKKLRNFEPPVSLAQQTISTGCAMTFRFYLLAGVAAVIVAGSLVPATSGIMLLAKATAQTTTGVSHQVVDRSNKGNRLTVSRAAARTPATANRIPVKTVTIRRGEPPKPVVQKRPLGCDPLFSPATTPALKHLFGRCIT